MMRLVLLFLLTTLGVAAELRTYDVRLDCQADGTARATLRLSLTQLRSGRILIPVGFKGIEGLTMNRAPEGTRLEAGPSNGQSLVALDLPEGIRSDASVEFSFKVPRPFQASDPAPGQKATLPKGSQLLKHAFVNTQETPIGTYRVEVRFPVGFRAHGILEALPRLGKSEAGPRALLDRFEGREGVLLKVDNLKQGESASLLVELAPVRRSWAWLIVGLVLSALYLFHFRDLVAQRS